jgi:hypothetical protein
VPQGLPALVAPRDTRDTQDQQGLRGLRGQPELRERPVLRGTPAPQVTQGQLAIQELLGME